MAYEPFVGFGTRKGIVYELDAYGLPKGTYTLNDYDVEVFTTDPYVGLEIYGIRSFEITYPEPRRIPHFNGDRVELVQQFPTLDAAAGTIVVDGADLNLASVLGSVRKATVSGMELMPHMSDQQGSEPSIGLIVYQAAKKSTGVTGWHAHIIQSTTMIPRPGPFGDNNYETRYALAPNAVAHHLWGFALDVDVEGTASAGVIEAWSLYPPRVTAWWADGAEDSFVFNEDLQPPDNTYPVYQAIAGVVTAVTSGVTKTTTGLVFSLAPAEDTKILVPHVVNV
jgi:hypothetical protein